MNPASFLPLIQEDRDEAAAAAAWLSAHEGEPPPESVATTIRGLASRIEQTILAPGALPREIAALCAGARESGFYGVCVSPVHVPLAVRELAGTGVAVVTVIGFPSGAHRSKAKASEAGCAVQDGATELDMVIPIGLLRAGLDVAVREDIEAVVRAASGRLVKVILETALLTDEEKIRGARLVREAGATFLKTSTGFGPGGATEADVALLRREAGARMGVKAAGGIRSAATALRMVACGADRIGTSSGPAIIGAATSA